MLRCTPRCRSAATVTTSRCANSSCCLTLGRTYSSNSSSDVKPSVHCASRTPWQSPSHRKVASASCSSVGQFGTPPPPAAISLAVGSNVQLGPHLFHAQPLHPCTAIASSSDYTAPYLLLGGVEYMQTYPRNTTTVTLPTNARALLLYLVAPSHRKCEQQTVHGLPRTFFCTAIGSPSLMPYTTAAPTAEPSSTVGIKPAHRGRQSRRQSCPCAW
jgi:hypothetical protein